jgi:hypothetical protein
MFDSITPADCPPGAQLIAYYIDGEWAKTADEVRASHPSEILVPISAVGTDAGLVLDVERGNASPGFAPGWVSQRRAAGVTPSVYCNLSTWPAVRAAFAAQGVAEPPYWVAGWDGIADIEAGAVAEQYGNPIYTHGHYDVSQVSDYWPGVDPAPAPSPSPSDLGGLTVSEVEFLYTQIQKVASAAGVALDPLPRIVPAPAPAPAPSPPPARTYIVKPGDFLSTIAFNELGDGNRWPEIYNLNRAVVGANPDLIHPGQVLTLPPH